MSRWFRHYAGMMRDEKLVSVAVKSKQPVERVIWVWGAILESAAEEQDGGRFNLDPDEAAYFLRCDSSAVCDILVALENLGRLNKGVVARWGDRQYESDASTERVRKFREKRVQTEASEQRNGPSDIRNANETAPDRFVTPPDTDTDTDTDTEKKKINVRKKYPEDFLSFWTAYPIDPGMSKLEAFAAWDRLTADDHQSAIAAIPAFKTWIGKQGTDYRTVHACRYLSKRRFDGFKEQAVAQEPLSPNGKVYIKQGTDAWDAWDTHYRLVKHKPPPHDTKGGWWFPSEFPEAEQKEITT